MRLQYVTRLALGCFRAPFCCQKWFTYHTAEYWLFGIVSFRIAPSCSIPADRIGSWIAFSNTRVVIPLTTESGASSVAHLAPATLSHGFLGKIRHPLRRALSDYWREEVNQSQDHAEIPQGRWGMDEGFFRSMEVYGRIRKAAVARLNLLDVETYYSFDEFGPCQWDFALRNSAGDTPEAGLLRSKIGGFRILLRLQKGQKYLQPSG